MGYNDRKQKEKEIRRKDIIDAAERVFFSKGFENASMDEVAKEAEFSKRTVYLYFNSKEQIYFEIMIRGYRLLNEMIENSFKASPAKDALDELRNIFFTFFAFSQNHPEYFKAIMEYETKDSADQLSVKDESKAECYRLGEVIFGYLFRALQKGVAEGSLRNGLGTKQTALMLWACTIGVYNTAKKKGDYLQKYHSVAPNEFISESFQLVMRLIGTGKGDRDEKGT